MLRTSLLLRHGLKLSNTQATRTVTTSPVLAAANARKAIANFPRPVKRAAKPSNPVQDGPLDSYQLTAQLKRITSQSSWSRALTLLHTAPPHAATTVVWNVLLNAILQNNTSEGTGQIKRAYEVWHDMKKRGVKPTARSFGTFLSGAAKIAKKLEARGVAKGDGPPKEVIGSDVRNKVEIIHKQWLVYQLRVQEKQPEATEAVKEGEDTVTDLNVHPTNQYLAFLASSLSLSTEPATVSKHLSHLMTTFDSIAMPTAAEPVTRNAVTYALVLNALRTALHLSLSSRPPPSFPTSQQLLDGALAIFSPLVTERHLPDQDPLTPQLATSFLSLFLLPPASTISLSTQQSILDLLPRMHGLVSPGELASLAPPAAATVPVPVSSPALDSGALKCVLSVLSKWEKHDHVQAVWEQVNEYPERYFASGTNETEIEHAEVVIESFGKLGDIDSAQAMLNRLLLEPQGSVLRPRLQTLETVLEASLRSGNYPAALATYQLFSSPSSTLTSCDKDDPSLDSRVEFSPSFKATTTLLLTAYNSRDKTKIWSILKLLTLSPSEGGSAHSHLFGPTKFPPSSTTTNRSKADFAGLTKKELAIVRIQQKRDLKFQLRYGQTLVKALERVLQGREISFGSNGSNTRDMLEKWYEQVRPWVQARERVEGREKGEMESRRERIVTRRSEDPTTTSPVKVVSQEELETLATAPKVDRESFTRPALGSEEEQRKVGRKERRMSWWKEREGDSGKLEREIYESRQKRFDDRNANRNSRNDDRAAGRNRNEFGSGRRDSFGQDGPTRSSRFENDRIGQSSSRDGYREDSRKGRTGGGGQFTRRRY
ncbi:uncharacterized protein JCM15063_006249 [Sporobolomyces koalae]|uniref:uncharacterized protein n=1 Tax=Sporobolomyces koalae TaxID=500713 RepID=UPI0031741233